MNPAYKLVQVRHGVTSVHALAVGETFHPVIGPAAEAEALYVRQLRLRERLAGHHGTFVIWDVGLGAAANALGVMRATRDLAPDLHLISFDRTLEPLRFALEHTAELGYLAGYEAPLQRLVQTGSVAFHQLEQAVRWEVRVGDFSAFVGTDAARGLPKPHAILFDPYSPARNPEMWTLPLFRQLFQLLDPGRPCALPTYSRSTMLRVTLLLAGFFVGRGHATGEKEETTIAANSRALIDEPLDADWLRRARNSTSAEPLQGPAYRQARLSPNSYMQLLAHPQFRLPVTS